MKPREIKPGIYSVGAIDWDRRLFDSLIPLPDGTSYNAYLVKGSEKTALIDTVDPPMQDVLIDHLDEAGIDKIKGGTAAENADIIRNVLSGEKGHRRDIVLLNTAAVLLAGDKVENMMQGIRLADEVIDSGGALYRLEQLISCSQA